MAFDEGGPNRPFSRNGDLPVLYKDSLYLRDPNTHSPILDRATKHTPSPNTKNHNIVRNSYFALFLLALASPIVLLAPAARKYVESGFNHLERLYVFESLERTTGSYAPKSQFTQDHYQELHGAVLKNQDNLDSLRVYAGVASQLNKATNLFNEGEWNQAFNVLDKADQLRHAPYLGSQEVRGK